MLLKFARSKNLNDDKLRFPGRLHHLSSQIKILIKPLVMNESVAKESGVQFSSMEIQTSLRKCKEQNPAHKQTKTK